MGVHLMGWSLSPSWEVSCLVFLKLFQGVCVLLMLFLLCVVVSVSEN